MVRTRKVLREGRTYSMFKALDPHEKPLDHGCRVCHTHLLSRTPHVGLLPVEYSLHQQPVQDPIDIPHPRSPVSHPASSLHPGEPDKVTEVEVVSLIMVPVFSLAINPLNQRVRSGVGASVHGRAVGRASVCHMRHTGDGALAVATRHVVSGVQPGTHWPLEV